MYTLLSMIYRLFNLAVLLMSQVHVLKKLPYFFNVHLGCFVDFILWPTDKYMFKVNDKKID